MARGSITDRLAISFSYDWMVIETMNTVSID